MAESSRFVYVTYVRTTPEKLPGRPPLQLLGRPNLLPSTVASLVQPVRGDRRLSPHWRRRLQPAGNSAWPGPGGAEKRRRSVEGDFDASSCFKLFLSLILWRQGGEVSNVER
jgi:hypothetical protein